MNLEKHLEKHALSPSYDAEMHQKWLILKKSAQITFLHISWICAWISGYAMKPRLNPQDSDNLSIKFLLRKQKKRSETSRVNTENVSRSEAHPPSEQSANKSAIAVERVGRFYGKYYDKVPKRTLAWLLFCGAYVLGVYDSKVNRRETTSSTFILAKHPAFINSKMSQIRKIIGTSP